MLALVLAVQDTYLAPRLPDLGELASENLPALLNTLFSPRIIALQLLAAVLVMICYGAIITSQLAVARDDESVSATAAFGASARRLPGMVLAVVLYGLAIVLGLVAFVVPGIYLGGRLQLWMAAMFAEDASAIASLRASWRLMQGQWWRGTTIFSVAVLVMTVAALAIDVIEGIVEFSHGDAVGRQIIVELFALPLSTIVYPMTSAVWIALYQDLKLRREGADLHVRAGALLE